MARREVYVAGAGGHAKVVLSTLLACGFAPKAIYDDAPETWGKTVLGVPVLGPIGDLAARLPLPVVVAVGSNSARKTVVARLDGAEWVTTVHPTAFVDPTVNLGPGTVVFAGAMVQTDTRIGEHCIVNTGATIDHDCVFGPFAHAAPGSHCAGGVHLGEGALLGIGACVIPGRRVGAWARVGAGATVVRDLPEGVTAVGCPARPLPDRRTPA
ncbi:MAG: acetyltransferase [Deltaproteobacteria bacterium]|nr:acetyltransferase [Deltaproteobacteria bacterium]